MTLSVLCLVFKLSLGWCRVVNMTIPHFEGYRHGLLHRYSVAFQSYLEAIAACMENFVLLECYGWEESKKEEDEEHENDETENEVNNVENAQDMDKEQGTEGSKNVDDKENETLATEDDGQGDKQSQHILAMRLKNVL